VSSGCAALAEVVFDGGGPVGVAAGAGFVVGAVAGAPLTVACLPVTGLLVKADGGCHGVGAAVMLAMPSIVTGAVGAVVVAAPVAVAAAPFWLLGELLDSLVSGSRREASETPWTGPEPDPPSGPPFLEGPPPEEAVVAGTPPEAPPRPCAPPPATASAAPPPTPEAPPAPPGPPPVEAAACCHSLAIAPHLPAHEHGAGLTQALYEALSHDRARDEAERLLAGRADATPLLLRGLSDEARAPSVARVLIARGDEPGLPLALAEVASSEDAPRRARLLARAVLLELEARRLRERAGGR